MSSGLPESPKQELAFARIAVELDLGKAICRDEEAVVGVLGMEVGRGGRTESADVPVRCTWPPMPVVGVGVLFAPQPEMVTTRFAATTLRESGNGSKGSLRSR